MYAYQRILLGKQRNWTVSLDCILTNIAEYTLAFREEFYIQTQSLT